MKITVDYDGLAKGLYDLFDDNERAALAFGLLPAVKMEVLKKQLEAKAKALFPEPEELFDPGELAQLAECPPLLEKSREVQAEERKKWTRETEHKVAVALYGVAPMVV